MALVVCVGAYGFLAAFGYHEMQAEQLAAKTMRLSAMAQRRSELIRKKALLEQVNRFSNEVTAYQLARPDWLFYDVNVQGGFNYHTAQMIIQQCSDSDLAYYWPIMLEIKSVDSKAQPGNQTAKTPIQGDVQLTVKGQFVARK